MAIARIENALLSVSDKSRLVDFAQGLVKQGVSLYASGGTRRLLEQAGLEVREVASYTGFPEMLDGRIKTLHPKIHGGILCRRDRPDDMQALSQHDIVPFDLVVVNLYPFEQTIAKKDVSDEQAIEQIDIGGPTLIRAAAKNHRFVTVVTKASQYEKVLHAVTESGGADDELRRTLAAEAFEHTATYDRAIANWFAAGFDDDPFKGDFPINLSATFRRQQTLRYGENHHQRAALYRDPSQSGGLVNGRQLHGKELSFNNFLDLESAWSLARSLPYAGASVIKHNNPCGAASATALSEAARKALAGDPTSAFGSVLSFNQSVDAETAEALAEPGLFIEAIAAPSFSPEAVEILTTRPKWKNNVRLVEVAETSSHESKQWRFLQGGALVQDADTQADSRGDWQVPTEAKPAGEQLDELAFAWEVVRHIKSNAIALCRDRSLVGAGAGQMSRVDSVEIAIRKAGERAAGSVLSSDAFFPFPDSIHHAAEAGVKAIIQPGGSKRDDEVIAACNERGLPMVFTGRRHFRH